MWKRLKKILIIASVSLVLAVVLAILTYNWLFASKVDRFLTAEVQSLLEEQFQREVSVGAVHLSFPNPGLVISNLAIAREQKLSEGTLFSAKRIQATVLLKSLVSRYIFIDDIILDTPTVWVQFDENGQSNLPPFGGNGKKESPARFNSQELVKRLSFPHIQLIDGEVYFAHQQRQLRVSIASLNTIVSLRLEDLQGTGHLSLEGGEIEWQDRGTLAIAMRGDLQLQDNDLTLPTFTLQAGETTVEAEGVVRNLTQPVLDLAVNADVALDEIDRFAGVDQNLSGMVHFTGNVSGNVSDITASGHLTCEKGSAWELAFENVDINAQYYDKQLLISSLGLDLWDGSVHGNGRLSFSEPQDYEAALVVENIELSNLNSIVEEPLDVAGNVSGTVKVRGESFGFDDLVVESTLHLQDDYIYGVDIAEGAAEIAVRGKTLFIQSLAANVFEGNVTAKGSLDLYDDFAYHVNLETREVELASIMTLIPPEPPDVSGKLSGKILADGSHFDLKHLELTSDVGIVGLTAYNVQAKTVHLSAVIRDQTLSVSQLSARLFSGNIEGTGKLALNGDISPQFETALQLHDISLQAVMQQFVTQSQEQDVDVSGTVGGDVTCRGASFALKDIRGTVDLKGAGHLKVAATHSDRKEEVPFDVKLTGALQNNVVAIAALNVESSALHVDTSGTIDLQGPSFDLAYQVAAQDLHTLLNQALAFVPGMEQDSFLYQFAGDIKELHGTLQGPLPDLNIEANAHVADADFVWVQADDMIAEMSLHGSMLTIQQARVTYRGASVLARGTIDLTEPSEPLVDIPVSLKTADLADYLAMVKQEFPMTGTLQGIDATLRGAVSSLRADVEVNIRRGSAWGQSFDAIHGTLALIENRIEIEPLTVKKNGGTIDLRGFFDFDSSFQVEGSVKNLNFHDIDALKSVAVQYEGLVDLSFEAKGTVQSPKGTADITFKHLSYANTPIEDITCALVLEGQKIRADISTFRNKVIASVELGLNAELRYKAELLLKEAAVEQLLSLTVELEDFSGIVTGRVTSEGSLRNLQGLEADVKLSQLDLTMFGQRIKNTKEIDVVVTQHQLLVNSLELSGGEQGIFAQGFLDFQGNFDLDVDGVLELRPLRAFLPKAAGITSLDGRVQLICNVRGTFKEPNIEGVLEIHRGNVKFAAYPDPITAINGKLAFTQGRVEIVRVDGRVSEGAFHVDGAVEYAGMTPENFRINIDGKKMVLENIVDELKVTVSSTVRLSGNLEHQELDGEIFIHNALYTKEVDLQSFLKNSNRNLSLVSLDSTADSPMFMPELFLKIRAPKNIRFKNKMADINLKADLLVQGTIAEPQIGGRVEILDGKIMFGDIRYDILGAVFDFIDPLRLNPEMNVQVETVIQEYKVRLGIEGNLDQFSLEMSSDPSLSDSEIAQLIAVGTGAKTNAYNFVTKPLQTMLEGQLEKAFNLDRISVDVDPLLSGSKDSETSPTLTVAKRFFDALMLTYKTSVGGVERSQLLEMEYEISDNVSITARRNEQGEYDTSVTFKFKFK